MPDAPVKKALDPVLAFKKSDSFGGDIAGIPVAVFAMAAGAAAAGSHRTPWLLSQGQERCGRR